MKYTCSVDIDLPIARVVALWDDPEHFKDWQDGFVRMEHMSGTPGEVGAKSMIHLLGKQGEMELMETLITVDLPAEKKALYEHVHMTNTQSTRFESLDERTTRYFSEVEYTEFNGVMIKLMAKLFPGKFKGQSQKWMDQFKVFAESHSRSISPTS